jgi:catechol 2,3-dioxygenase-like lactoylglutathione lyase family enzyme
LTWYGRPVLFVADIDRAVRFYVSLGFLEAWRHLEAGIALVAQVERDGCEMLLSSQWPKKSGSGMMFISLERAAFDAFRDQLEQHAVASSEGHWGYRVLIVPDRDGNQLYFPFPDEEGSHDQGSHEQGSHEKESQ